MHRRAFHAQFRLKMEIQQKTDFFAFFQLWLIETYFLLTANLFVSSGTHYMMRTLAGLTSPRFCVVQVVFDTSASMWARSSKQGYDGVTFKTLTFSWAHCGHWIVSSTRHCRQLHLTPALHQLRCLSSLISPWAHKYFVSAVQDGIIKSDFMLSVDVGLWVCSFFILTFVLSDL